VSGDLDLWDALQATLAACQLVLGADSPERAFVTIGEPPQETDDHLVVYLDQSAPWPYQGVGGVTEPRTLDMIVLPRFPISLLLGRRAPGPAGQGEAFMPDQQAAAQQVSKDIWRLWNGVPKHIILPTGFPEIPASINLVTPKLEAGLILGCIMTYLVTIPGGDPLTW
jgi:hypothetical protein